ncbi:DUF5131 family protein [Streptomyces sp. MN6]
MATTTSIEWTQGPDGTPGKTWNPVVGCTRVSPGCDNCYAISTARIRSGNPNPKTSEAYAGTTRRPFVGDGIDWSGKLNLLDDRLDKPYRWKKPRRVFVNSTSDLFHDQVPDLYLTRIFEVMEANPQHTFMILTKRHARMRSFLKRRHQQRLDYAAKWNNHPDEGKRNCPAARDARARAVPPANIWVGVSVENQEWANTRIPVLLDTPAAVRFLSCEPLLGPVDLKQAVRVMGSERGHGLTASFVHAGGCCERKFHGIDWVIVGGESGPRARPMHVDWARSLRDQCAGAGIPFFFKQHGEYLCARVEDDDRFSGGRAYDDPSGGRSSATLRERGPSGTFRGGTTRLMEPGDATRSTVMLDPDTIAVRVGKKQAGRLLDGREHNAFPDTP